MRGCDGRGWLKFITIWLRLTEGTKRSKLGTSSLICNFTESICMGIKSSCPSFIHRNKRKKTEGHAGWLFLPIRQSFPCSHLNHPPTTKSVSHLSFLLTHFMYPCNSVRMWLLVCVPMCVYVWLGRLILSARKCPAARIWSDMVPKRAWSHFLLAWSTATAMPKTGRECWENLHIARNKFEMQLKKIPPNCQKLY